MSRAATKSRPSYTAIGFLCLASILTLNVAVNFNKNRPSLDVVIADVRYLLDSLFNGMAIKVVVSASSSVTGPAYAATTQVYDRLASDGAFYRSVEHIVQGLSRSPNILPWDKDGDGKYMQLFREPYWALQRYYNEMYPREPELTPRDMAELRLPERIDVPNYYIHGDTSDIPGGNQNNNFNMCYYRDFSSLNCNEYPPGGGGGPSPHKPPSAAPEPSDWALSILSVGGMGLALRTRRRQRSLTRA